MPEWVYILATMVCLLPIGMAVVVCKLLEAMSKTAVEPVSADADSDNYTKVKQHDDWAQSQGFQWLGSYAICINDNRVFIGAWRHAEQSIYFCVYCYSSGLAFDFVTVFSDGVSLTTGRSKDGHMFPQRPGSYMQTFPGISIEQLWEQHLAGEAFIISQLDVTPRPEEEPFEQVITSAMHEQVA